MIINGFGGSSSSASVASANAFLAASDSLRVYSTLLLPSTGVGAMLAEVAVAEGVATSSTSGMSTLISLNTYEDVINNSTAFNIINKSGYIWRQVCLNTVASELWVSNLPDTYTVPTTTFSIVANTTAYACYTNIDIKRTMGTSTTYVVQCADSVSSSGSYESYGIAKFLINNPWTRGYNYLTGKITSSSSSSEEVTFCIGTPEVNLVGNQGTSYQTIYNYGMANKVYKFNAGSQAKVSIGGNTIWNTVAPDRNKVVQIVLVVHGYGGNRTWGLLPFTLSKS